MRIKFHTLEAKYEMLKQICRGRRRAILDLEEKLKTALGSQNMEEKENCDTARVSQNRLVVLDHPNGWDWHSTTAL